MLDEPRSTSLVKSRPESRPEIRPEVRWTPDLLEAGLDHAVRAWANSLHAFAKRLPPLERARFLMALDSAVYPMHGESAIAANDQLHPKHRLMGYHDFFVQRVTPGERVIDLGSGVGALACAIASRAKSRVVGVEWSEKTIAQARARAVEQGLGRRVSFELGDITRHRAEGTFDCVVLSNVLEHITDRSERLAMWREWYAPTKFLIRVPAFDRDWRVAWKKELGVEWRGDDTHETEHTREELQRELARAGLTVRELLVNWGEYWVAAS